MTKAEYEKMRQEKIRTNEFMRNRKKGRYFKCGVKDNRSFGTFAFAPSRGTMNGKALWT
jgi:hypothetical protein